MRRILLLVGVLVIPFAGSSAHHELVYQSPTIEQGSRVDINGAQAQISVLVSTNPRGIERYVNGNRNASLREVWRKLGMRYSPSDMSYECSDGCEAISFPVSSNDNMGDFSIVKISWEGGDFYQYLVFKGSEEDWRFVGHIESVGQRYGSPEHRIEKGDRQTWLVIRELQGRGSGVVLYGDLWYELGNDGLKRALSYPASGHSVPLQRYVAREFQTKVVNHGPINGAYTVEVEFSVAYGVGTVEDLPLFSKTQEGRYVWRPDRRKFVLDTATSELSSKEIEAVYNIDSLNDEQFVKYNFRELLLIARNGNPEQKEWLGEFLTKLSKSEQTLAIEKALALSARPNQ